MDGYSKAAMMERCRDDYNWSFFKSSEITMQEQRLEQERVDMMSYLYDNSNLWEYVSMVAFAEHYILDVDNDTTDDGGNTDKAYETFKRQKERQPPNEPIFGGVVWDTWQQDDSKKLPTLYKKNGIDYVRVHCNFGDGNTIGGATQLTSTNNPLFGQLARAAKECQINEMVPLLLLQVPWREDNSKEYFQQAMQSLASELQLAGVECNQLLLETRPPIGISAQEEEGLSCEARQELGFEIGQKMFQAIHTAFQGNTTIAGFCVAGGSTKGKFPTAMQDDTQNAVRQGMRSRAREVWGYDFCFWEMGAKLMLQPKVGRLWGDGEDGRDAARELFWVNARGMADEIRVGL